jgi:hypothetical protein
MSKSITAAVTLVAKAVPSGTIAGNFRIWLLSEAGVVIDQRDTADTTISFAIAEPGTYTVVAVRLDIAGGAISEAVSSAPFTIESAPATVSVDVPASVVVTLA